MSIERKDNITIVSGYWPVHNLHSHETYCKWFQNTLKINQRMYFFGDSSVKDLISPYRENLETIFVEHPIKQFYSNNFYSRYWTEPYHIPSIEIGKIWQEKINLLKIAKDMDGENATDYYIWYDAAAFPFRNQPPPSQRLTLKDGYNLPYNQILYSEPYPFRDNHIYSTIIQIIPKNVIDNLHILYYKCLRRIASSKPKKWQYGYDYIVFTELLKTYPLLFTKIAVGNGENIIKLYKHFL